MVRPLFAKQSVAVYTVSGFKSRQLRYKSAKMKKIAEI